jgi:peptidoglycan hydrolase-like protein with peptidoglycan-binding domain
MSYGRFMPMMETSEVILVLGIDLQAISRRLERAGFHPGLYIPPAVTLLSYAIKRFQHFAKVPKTGVLDRKIWDRMQRLSNPGLVTGPAERRLLFPVRIAFASTESAGAPSLKEVWPTSVIIAVQTALTALGYEISAPQGTLDATTQQALRQFQNTHQLPDQGSLTKETLLALLDERCKPGCTMTVLVSATEETQAQQTPMTRIALAGAGWWSLFVQGIQRMLTQQGYDTHGIDGTLGPATYQAIRAFQKASHLAENGDLTGETVLALLAASCQSACEFAMSVQPQGQGQAGLATTHTDTIVLKKLDPAQSPEPVSLQLHDVAYASEKIECSDISGDWVILYWGTIVEQDDKAVALRLEERFGYRYYPNQDGLNRTDWWCIPRRRHCYSTISFSDWGGTFSKNAVQRFPIEHVYDARLGIINSMSALLHQQCQR